MRRSLGASTILASVLLLTAPAGATRIEFLWEATGTNHIAVLPGAEIVLQAWVVVEEPGIALAAVSALRPSDAQSTWRPAARRFSPTAEPISPG